MKRFLSILIIISFSFIYSVFAQSVGTTSFNFLKNQYSPRAAALANNLIAIQGDINTMFNNPAGLSGIENRQWAINYINHLLDFQGGQFAYVVPNKKFGVIGVGLLYFSYGDFEETNEFGKLTGNTFGASEFALAVSTANTLGEGFDYGVNVKFIYSSLANYSASALAIDAGLLYTIQQLNDLRIGVSLANVGTVVDKYTDAEEKLPLLLRIGLSKRLAHLPLTISASFNDLTATTNESMSFLKRFSVAGEFEVSRAVRFRLGYDNDVNQGVKPLGTNSFGGIAAGLGILWKSFRIDYAYSSYGELGSQNRLGVSGTF